MIKTERVLHLKSCVGRKLRVVREHYLRERVPCCSSLCQADCVNDGKLLPGDLTHYVVPDVAVVVDYLEILEFRELQGIIFTQTACQALQSKNRRYYKRLQTLVKDPRHDCVLFANEFQKYSYCPREKGESQEKWQTRSVCVYSAAVWYYNHLAGMMNIVMITEDPEAVAQFSSLTSGVYVISVQDYLQSFWSDLQAAHELFSSISQAQQETEGDDGEKEFPEHLPAEVLEAGIKSERYIQSTLNVNKHRAQNEAFVRPKNFSTKSTGENALHFQNRWNRHIKLIFARRRIVGILQRNWRDYVRIPKIRISTQQAEALQDHRVVVRIDSWESTSFYPNGHSVRVLGRAGELETEVQTILLENCIHILPFSDAQLREMPVNSLEKPWTVDPSEVAERRDLRDSRLVFSIDPRGCEDVDDTLSVHKLPNRRLELGVHIADVTHFVKEGSLTDLEARSRATTYYLADRRYDMLPAILSADLCSLLGGADRYAMSVLWELDAESLEVQEVWYGRTLIRSSYQLHYELAQALLNGEQVEVAELANLGPQEKGSKLAQLTEALEMLTHVARHLRAKRDRGGALELEGVGAQLDEERNITALVPRQPLEVHETVAECMIYANHWVARVTTTTTELFNQLVDTAKAKGFTIDTSCSLDRAVDHRTLGEQVVQNDGHTAMSQALYFSTGAHPQDQYYHYGTIPCTVWLGSLHTLYLTIRRYADIVVHRLLTAALHINKEVEEMAHHVNSKNRVRGSQMRSTALFQCLFFRERDPQTDPCCVADAVVYSIRDNGVLVFIQSKTFKQRGLVVVAGQDGSCDWQGGTVRKYPDRITTTSSCGTSTFKLFDHITVSHRKRHQQQASPQCKVPAASPQGRSQLVKEVVRQNEEALAQEKTARRPKLSKEEREFRQSKTPSLYSILEEIRELALMDLERASRLPATTA
uniref:DIS3-like exonuclease 1 n=1 Tax=Maylandia zebra TaxID=106582 RepID=A0A3P9CKK3_9CICH